MGTTSVVYDLIGRDTSLSRTFKHAGDEAEGFGTKVKKAGAMAVAAGAAIGAGAAVIGAEAVKAGTEFQSAMEKIHTQAGASQAAVDSLTKSVLAMAPSTQQGPQQLAEALYHLKSVGLDNAGALKALKTASDLAAVGGANLEDTTNALAGAWRSGIKGAQSFGQTAATVNAIIGAGNMQMTDLVAAIGTGILPAAKTFGVSLQSVGAALALMTDEGVPAQDAATRLRMSLSLLGAPSQEAEKSLKMIGLTGLDLANAMRSPGGLVSAIELLKGHLDASGLSASKQAQILSRAFGGGQSSSAILTMVNNLDVLEGKQKQINSTIGNYGGAVQAQRKTAAAQFALLRSSVDTLGVRLGLDLLPPVTKFVGWLASTGVPGVEKFTKKVIGLLPVKAVEDDAKKIIDVISNFLGIGGGSKEKPAITVPWKLTQATGSMGPGLPKATPKAPIQIPWQLTATTNLTASGIKPVAESLTSVLRKVNWSKILGDVIKSAVSGAQQIGAAFITLIGKVNWLEAGKQAAFALVPFAVGLVTNLVTAIIGEAIHHPLDMLAFLGALIPAGKGAEIILKLFGEIKFIGPLLKFFLTPLVKAGDAMESLLGKVLKKVFGPVADRIGGYFSGAKNWLVGKGESILLGLWYGAEGAWARVAGWLAKIGGFVLRPFEKAGSWLFGKGSDVIGGLWNGARAGWRLYWTWFIRIEGWVLGYFGKAGSWLVSKGSALFGGLLSGASRGWRVVSGWLAGTGGRIVRLFSKAGSWLIGAGRSIIGGLLGGIASAFRGIGGWIKRNVVDPLVNWVKHWFGIRSPSTVMAGIGGHLIGGLLKGLMSTGAGDIAKMVFGSLPGALAAIVEKGLVSIAKLPGKAISALAGLGSKGLSLLGKGLGWLAHLFSGGSGSGGPAVSLGKAMAAAMGWTGGNWTALYNLWSGESGWSVTARNPASGAYGIPQALPASKMASAGADWLTNPATQIRWGLGYIRDVYGTPWNAYMKWLSRVPHWYGHGGRFAAGQLIGVGDRGPELAVFDRPGSVLSPEQSAALLSASARGSDGGTFTGTLYLDSGELLGIVRGEIERDERETIQALSAGTGARR